MQVLVRADGGQNVGLGHLVRTSALAEVLVAKGHDVTYATTTSDMAREIVTERCGIITFDSDHPDDSFLDVVDKVRPDAVIIDSYDVGLSTRRAIADRSPALIEFVDQPDNPVIGDIVVNGNLYASGLDYTWSGQEPGWCLGPRYLPLRRSIAERAAAGTPWRDEPERALITMGGSDVNNMTPTAIYAFDGTNLELDVIVGPGVETIEDIVTATETADVPVRLHRAPENIEDLFANADLAVTAAGSTVYELLALGTPLIATVEADNQQLIGDALDERDLATVLPRNAGETAIADAVHAYLDGSPLRRRRRQLGRDLVDGRGAERVYRELLSLVPANEETT